MICSGKMTFTSSHTPRELGTPNLHTECLISDPPILCMQDIIDHEYALVESIPDEDRAALMPIIRFVKKTIQEPFTSLPQLSYGRTADALKLTTETRMRAYDNHCHSTNYRAPLREMGFHGKKELQGPLCEDAVGERSASMPHAYAFNGTRANHNLESCHVSMTWQKVACRHSSEGLYQQVNCHGALQNQEIDTFDSLRWGNPCLPLPKHENQADRLPPLTGGFVFSSSTYAGQNESDTRTSFKRDTESNFDNVCSSLDMDSFNLEELRRSLRPSEREMDSNGNDIKSGDVDNFGDGVDGEDDDMDEDDGNNDGYLFYPDQDEEQEDSDAEGPLYWGNGKNHHPTLCGDDRLQFPKVHCRRRLVIKKAVGWITKRAAESLVSRVRHKRKCNLPCCTNCETGTKRRKAASGYGSRKCARLSTMKKIASSLPATTSENATKSNRQLSKKARSAHIALACSESCDEEEASQVTQGLENSSLVTALTIVLTNSKRHGLTSSEALQALLQAGYLQAVGNEGHALASCVKTTLTECPQFKELKNHRFILNTGARAKLGHKVALGFLNCDSAQDEKLSVRARSLSQITCSQDLTKKVDPSSPSGMPCETPHQGGPRCLRSKGRCWQCSRTKHQQHPTTATTSGCSSCEIVDSCDASNETQQAAAKEEEMLGAFEDRQSIAGHQVEPTIRCCRTDGKNWQCSNEAQKGSMYCERHQSRCKKGMVKQAPPPCTVSQEKKKLQNKEASGQNQCSSHERKLSMQLRPRRRSTALDICLK